MKSLLLLLAVVLVSGCASGPYENTASPTAPTTTSWVSDPSDPNNVKIETEIRRAAGKPTGELTKADLEKITLLDLSSNRLTDVKRLEKLTKLEYLHLGWNKLNDVKVLEKCARLSSVRSGKKLAFLDLRNNPALTFAQIAELRKAFGPGFRTIDSNPTK